MNILIKKKLNIFIICENFTTIFDYINNNDFDEFIDLVVKSYLYQLSLNSDWKETWNKKCSLISNDKIKNILSIHNSEEYLFQHFNKNYNNVNKNNDLQNKFNNCYDIFKLKIIKAIELFKLNNKTKIKSYPSNNQFYNIIPTYPNVTVSTFYGFTIDIISGLFYLHDKFMNKKDYHFDSSLSFVDLDNNIINCNIVNEKNLKKICEVVGFEIYWKHFNFIISNSDRKILFNKLTTMTTLNKKYKYFVIPLAIELYCNNKFYSHSNFIIFDVTNLICYRFEPHGSEYPNKMNYKPKELDKNISTLVDFLELGFKFVSPEEYLPKISFQQKEIYEENSYVGDPDGFCSSWSIWWSDMLMSYPNINPNDLQKKLFYEITNSKILYRELIRNFSFNITKIRDEFLSQLNIDINDWTNDAIDDSTINKLNNLLIKKIKSYYY